LPGSFAVKVLSYQIPAAEIFKAAVDALEGGKGVFFVFDDVPVGVAYSFAECEEGLPVYVTFTDEGLIICFAEFLYMDSEGPSGVFVEILQGFAAALHRVANIKLHYDIIVCIGHQDVPRYLTIHRLEFVPVIVVAKEHVLCICFLGQFVEKFCGFEPGLWRVPVLIRQPWYDEVLVAESFVEFDCFVEVVAEQCIESCVCAAAGQAVVVEYFAHLFCVAVVVAGELNTHIAHLSDGFDGAGQVLGAIVADRVELEADFHSFFSAFRG
jgi:hypothetical protein